MHSIKTLSMQSIYRNDSNSQVIYVRASPYGHSIKGTGAIGSISLLVGGIGIMNIMLVSVTERTREIGIRMALGAKRRDVLLQFLTEAIVICVCCGAIGVLFAYLGALAVTKFSPIEVGISATGIAIAFSFSALIGIFFGFYPARRAAKLKPVEALRYELVALRAQH
jgi:putative ABC transport system permease protein